jgi:transketolase
LQGFGRSDEVITLAPLKEKWEAFNFAVTVADDGNDFTSLNAAFSSAESRTEGKPTCIIAQTIKGKSVSFMENKMEWHYLPMSDEQYRQAVQENEAAYA